MDQQGAEVFPIDVPRQAGVHVRRARDLQHMTRRELASRSGVSERTIASLELGDATGIQLDRLLAVASALGLRLGFVSAAGSREPTGRCNGADAGAHHEGTEAAEHCLPAGPQHHDDEGHDVANTSLGEYRDALASFLQSNYSDVIRKGR